MNLKKYIKLKEDAPKKAARSEKEQELYNELLQRVEQNAANHVATKKRVDLWKILTPVLSCACALAVTLICVFTIQAPNDIFYKEDKILSKETTFVALQNDTKYYDFAFIESKTDRIFMSYDSESNDKLYYSAFAEVELSTVNLVVVINEKYNYNFDIKDETVNKQLSDYAINYKSEGLRGKPQINYKGWIKVQTEIVYFDYIQMPELGDEAFFESIQQIIKVKK